MPATAGRSAEADERFFVWSNSRTRLLLGRVALLVYVYFNSRVLTKATRSLSATDWRSFLEELDAIPELDLDAVADDES